MNKLQTPLLILAAILSLGYGITHEFTATTATDYCAAANLRTCKVSDNGNWVTVTTPDGATTLLLLKNGRVTQVLR